MGITVEPNTCMPGNPLLAGLAVNKAPFPRLLSVRDTAFPPSD